ncbi:hypothetical protein TTHERM_000059209 (macronuclear) [Tetrahymena thermophila SB210]|uniref:Uncharacterized protein n=1 Tax=Tetrahymena thermophila (strain SB210) TaxID=312017 RepID=W7XFA7_TETTS|nr:hypothetical protein TTHERM_000059209 [Tetrahymena thermophila SB210]EWS76492.1 hypothetical protein TTHERM_000059209 [Tetrahymena thermophila SB210]|eukprot:XP_012650973.1 hypothetical protein TTHERM_000059209 [Tetrahymena thermophila SB210]
MRYKIVICFLQISNNTSNIQMKSNLLSYLECFQFFCYYFCLFIHNNPHKSFILLEGQIKNFLKMNLMHNNYPFQSACFPFRNLPLQHYYCNLLVYCQVQYLIQQIYFYGYSINFQQYLQSIQLQSKYLVCHLIIKLNPQEFLYIHLKPDKSLNLLLIF